MVSVIDPDFDSIVDQHKYSIKKYCVSEYEELHKNSCFSKNLQFDDVKISLVCKGEIVQAVYDIMVEDIDTNNRGTILYDFNNQYHESTLKKLLTFAKSESELKFNSDQLFKDVQMIYVLENTRRIGNCEPTKRCIDCNGAKEFASVNVRSRDIDNSYYRYNFFTKQHEFHKNIKTEHITETTTNKCHRCNGAGFVTCYLCKGTCQALLYDTINANYKNQRSVYDINTFNISINDMKYAKANDSKFIEDFSLKLPFNFVENNEARVYFEDIKKNFNPQLAFGDNFHHFMERLMIMRYDVYEYKCIVKGHLKRILIIGSNAELVDTSPLAAFLSRKLNRRECCKNSNVYFCNAFVVITNMALLIWGLINILFVTSWGNCDKEANVWLLVAGSVMITFACMSFVQQILVCKEERPRAKGACITFKILMMIFTFAWTIYGLILSSDSECASLDLSKDVSWGVWVFMIIMSYCGPEQQVDDDDD